MKKDKMFTQVRKRDGKELPFDQNRIAEAVFKAMKAVGEGSEKDAKSVSDFVVKQLLKEYPTEKILSIEEIQNMVIKSLILQKWVKTVEAYILYRQTRADLREQKKVIPEHVKKLVAESKKYFPNPMGEFIFYRSYSRWMEDEGRRETWIEAVQRYVDFMRENLGKKISDLEYEEVRQAILNHEVLPSMRLMWAAGKAARSTHVTGYNCSFIAPTCLKDLGEIMYLSMCGTGVGFSVEYETIGQLPIIKKQTGQKPVEIVVRDSKEGWADAFVKAMTFWFEGRDTVIDYSKLRPLGTRLRTMGGRSSGPGPLMALMDFARSKVLSRQRRRLKTIDAYDVICKIGEIVQMGGVRRSAMLSLSNLDDMEMRMAKQSDTLNKHLHRVITNNSVAYNEKPSSREFMKEWMALAESGSGERGIFNREGLQKQLPARRWKVFEEDAATSGTNPCGEIVLKSKQFCNLSEVKCQKKDTPESLFRKVRIATLIGTYQSSLTNFAYLSPEWKTNCEQERLLGVSLTGQQDCPVVQNAELLRNLRDSAIAANLEYAERIGIEPSTAVTCVKPSGTVSQLVDSSSGIHARWAPYYIRRFRISAADSLFQMMKDQKVPHNPEVGQREGTATTYVLDFPVKAPEGAVCRKDLSAIKQLEYWKLVKENWTEHNPSATIYIAADEWLAVGHWVYENWDAVGGLSFLPPDEHGYSLTPYEDISKERYEELAASFPAIDFAEIILYEKDDETKGAKELACAGGVCDI